MRNLKLIIHREYLARVRNKTFVVMTFLSPLILVGMVFLVAYLSSLNTSVIHTIGINDQSNLFENEFKDSETLQFIKLSGISLEDSKLLVLEKEYSGLLFIPEKETNVEMAKSVMFYGKESPSLGILQEIERVITGKLTKRELISRGVDISKIESAETRVSIQIQNFEGQ
ncbi:MAG: ABC transporter permease, partial [Gillisia sp.]